MINLLKWIEEISATRDRDHVAATMARAVFELLRAGSAMLFRVIHTADGPRVLPLLRCTARGVELVAWEDGRSARFGSDEGAPLDAFPLLARAFNSGMLGIETRPLGVALCWPVKARGATAPAAIVVADLEHLPNPEQTEVVTRFLNYCGNHVGLLDYSELDTLTGLHNRKTYDETFERLLAAIPRASAPPGGNERRHDAQADEAFWLGEVDIDHFKHINDNFGHLFGDEVLLRIANLMRHCFRASDNLYRFGGEEFVVMLRPCSRQSAEGVFERFREAVECHEFPQVGKVTCSIGYTRAVPGLLPADLLGRADAALYYSKDHGRNQANCYDDLVQRGLLVEQSVERLQFDAEIDALFG